MRFVSWNVNGIRAILKKGFLSRLREFDPDILCLQETRAHPDQVAARWPRKYWQYWNVAERKGYSGTAVFTRIEPEEVSMGIGEKLGDREGRVITLRFPDFYLVNVYTPNSRRDLSRLDYRTQVWDVAFLAYLRELEIRLPVVFCGDLNVAHREIDLANPRANRRNAGFTNEERARLTKYIEAGFVDTFREFELEGGHYSWWSYTGQARARNIGWRIDYFFVSQSLQPRLKEADILPWAIGSDHCPVGLTLE